MTPRRTVPVVIALASTSLLAMVASNTLLSDWVERQSARHPNPLSLDSGTLGPVEAAPPQDWPTWGNQPNPATGGSTPAPGATPPPPAITQPPAAGPGTSVHLTRHPTRKFRYVMVEEKRIIVLPPLPAKPLIARPQPTPEPPRPPQHRHHCDCHRHGRQSHSPAACADR